MKLKNLVKNNDISKKFKHKNGKMEKEQGP